MSTKLATINDLPCELIVYIIKRLNYDLINLLKLRLISRRWSILIKQNIKLTECNIIDINNFNNKNALDNYCWFFRNVPYIRPNVSSEIYYFKDKLFPIKCIQSNLFQTIFSNLKHLSLNLYYPSTEYDKFNLSILNEFKSLEQLDIFRLFIRNKAMILRLPNLKTLAIYYFRKIKNNNKNQLQIETIKLENLLINHNLEFVEFKYPQSIKCIELVDDVEYNLNCFSKFTNLEILYYDRLPSDFNLKLLPSSLKELHIMYDNLNYARRIIYDNLLNQRILLNRLDLIISWIGIKLIDTQQINQISLPNSISPELQFSNQELLVELPWLNEIKLNVTNSNYFNRFLTGSRFKQIVDSNIFSELNNIQIIDFYGNALENYQNDCIILISKLRNLKKLILTSALMDHKFFDKLPLVCPFLNHLEINFCYLKINLKNVISKLEYLISFKITDYSYKLNLNFLIDHLKKNKHLKYIESMIRRAGDYPNYYSNYRSIHSTKKLPKNKNFKIIRVDENRFIFNRKSNLTIDRLRIELLK